MDNKEEKSETNEPTFHEWYNFINSNIGKYLDKYYADLIESAKMSPAPNTVDEQIIATYTPHVRDTLLGIKSLPEEMLEYTREEQEKD